MFATDAKAVALADVAIAAGHDTAVEPDLRIFVDLPFQHAEDLALQDRCVALRRPLRGLYPFGESRLAVLVKRRS